MPPWRLEKLSENSIPAVESTIRYGTDIMALDLNMTRDSVLVLSHDRDVLRCTNLKKVFKDEPGKILRIEDLTLEEIKSLSLRRAHGVAVDTIKMPTLKEALAC